MNAAQVELVRANLRDVRRRIEAAGGDPERTTIVAVTKTFPVDAIRAAIAAGLRSVGENYAQEMAGKAEEMSEDATRPQWNLIGQLQSNKVKTLAEFVDVWQTVDSVKLVEEIAKRQPQARIFIQVNATGESGRGGCEWLDLDELCEAAEDHGLVIQGLMGVAPHDNDERSARLFFRRLARESFGRGFSDVSCGMSGDFEIAVEEGATVVRLGSALFGHRDGLRGKSART